MNGTDARAATWQAARALVPATNRAMDAPAAEAAPAAAQARGGAPDLGRIVREPALVTEEIVADEKPPTPDDPRSAAMRNLGPHIGPGI